MLVSVVENNYEGVVVRESECVQGNGICEGVEREGSRKRRLSGKEKERVIYIEYKNNNEGEK